jgi:hypothetical protein
MNKIGAYFAIGCVVAIIGMFFASICGDLFSLNYASAYILGMGMYLCVVIVTCTGFIVSKIESNQNDDKTDKKED